MPTVGVERAELLDVGAGGEGLSFASEDHGAHVAGLRDSLDGLRQRVGEREVQRVQLLGSVQREQLDPSDSFAAQTVVSHGTSSQHIVRPPLTDSV